MKYELTIDKVRTVEFYLDSRVIRVHTLLPSLSGYSHERAAASRMAAGLGFEPRLMDSESTCLPLADPAIVSSKPD